MDDLSYTYKADKPNQLLRVDDTVADTAVANADIDDQDGNNYAYNAIGQLIRNNTEDIDYFYNASGLVSQVDQGGQPAVKFHYNDRNHRVKKESYVDGNLSQTTYYVRDVAGQVMAIYSDGGGSMALVERPIYGSGRVGVAYTGGNTLYELTDHLGNVRAVFSKDQGNTELEGYTDYYPFGMPMPQRNTLEGEAQYRYAYQGQEKDDETGKEAFELRLWDSRIGRWLTTDPAKQYNSPYLGMGNNPINRFDTDGGFDEFVQNEDGTWKKISNLGGDKTHFYHFTQGSKAGMTAITHTSGTAWMSTSKFIQGYMQRNFQTDYKDITSEFFNGTGPENSVMYGADHPMNKDLMMSYVAFRAREKFLNSNGSKVAGSADFGLAGVLRSNVNMTEQMVGSANYSVYPLGDDNVMIMIFDSKSRYSLYYHLPWIENKPRSYGLQPNGPRINGEITWGFPDNRKTTTRQTYIWIESVENLQKNHYLYDSRFNSDW